MNSSRATRYGIELVLPDSYKTRERLDCIPRESAARLTFRFSAHRRGEHKIGTLDLTSCYPLGFVRASKRFVSNQSYVVYPRPAGNPQLPTNRSRFADNWVQQGIGPGDDFAGVRAYVPGESQRNIDWKAVARGQPLMTKQFSGETESGPLYLDYASAGSGQLEDRLSQLTLWIIEAERLRLPYGLRLPNT